MDTLDGITTTSSNRKSLLVSSTSTHVSSAKVSILYNLSPGASEGVFEPSRKCCREDNFDLPSVHQMMGAFLVMKTDLSQLVQPSNSLPSAQQGHYKVSCSTAYHPSLRAPSPRCALHSLSAIQPPRCAPSPSCPAFLASGGLIVPSDLLLFHLSCLLVTITINIVLLQLLLHSSIVLTNAQSSLLSPISRPNDRPSRRNSGHVKNSKPKVF